MKVDDAKKMIAILQAAVSLADQAGHDELPDIGLDAIFMVDDIARAELQLEIEAEKLKQNPRDGNG